MELKQLSVVARMQMRLERLCLFDVLSFACRCGDDSFEGMMTKQAKDTD